MDNAKNIDAVIPIYNLNKYSDNYSQNLEVYGNMTEMMNQL